MDTQFLYDKIEDYQRINATEALHLYQNASWLKIGQLAAKRRNHVLSQDHASYTMFRMVNYTSICTIGCKFCSFQDQEHHPNAYVLNFDEISQKIEHGLNMGADQIFFQGGVHPKLPLDYYLEILECIKNKYNIHIRGFSPVELQSLAQTNQMPLKKLLIYLKNAGLDSVPGAGAEILVERVRKILSPQKCTVQEWVDILRTCHEEGLYSSSNIVVGSVETQEEVIQHLQVIRDLQDQTKGFHSFIPWKFQPQTKQFPIRSIPHHEYLKLLGVCRIFLDNIDHIEVSVMVFGKDIGQLALHMGADDISSPVIEENVLKSYGIKTEQQARKLIENAGLKPIRRDFNYKNV